ncbi:Uncharacterized protein BP5553_02284 [Venustampulla echinocandica]|uniref:SnoaL-like domain-containing protein n=1 Tax=Venustampulla echinocandica TaxID=2656787 RepID=A0A370U3G8_9HELO|nr:Uncharacterized protein BP5553_02284 [Venustampulla echinocandica]RDL42305.1 Uncharacterized protein BP5553_02284 [Venustampulla echinocandica]
MSLGVPVAQSTVNPGSLGIENTNIETAPGVDLSVQQKILVGSILDLLAGRPSLKKLQLWADDATFADPLTNAQGRKQYEAQWYSLETAFSEIERLHQSVTSAGNPITMDVKTRYKIKGIGKDQIIDSVVQIYTDDMGEGIVRVENRWNNELPHGAFSKIWRNLNSMVIPAFVHVPKNDAEDSKPRN